MQHQRQFRLRPFLIVVAIVLATDLCLLITDTRILVRETRTEPGQEFFVEGYGNLGNSSQAKLVCRYFTGRRILTSVYFYSSANIFGRDSCPFLNRGLGY